MIKHINSINKHKNKTYLQDTTMSDRLFIFDTTLREGEQVLLGGNDKYISLCRKHWKNGDLGKR